MGQVYAIPVVNEMTFTPTGYNRVNISTFDSAQRSAWDTIISQGIMVSANEWIVSIVSGNYVGFYTSNNKYYVGYSHHGGDEYIACKVTLGSTIEGYLVIDSAAPGIMISDYGHATHNLPSGVEPYNSYQELYDALSEIRRFPITYRPINCSFPDAPTEAMVGDTVTVSVSFPEGYGIVNNSDIYVTCNGVMVPSTYNSGILTFTMPDPS